jgi:hypothetical protein
MNGQNERRQQIIPITYHVYVFTMSLRGREEEAGQNWDSAE